MNPILKMLRTASFVLPLALAAPGAYAAACSAYSTAGLDPLVAGSPGDVDTGDMTFRGSAADACSALYDGNDTQAQIQLIAGGLGWGTAANYLYDIKAEDAPGADSFLGVNWTLAYTDAGTPNTWSLTYEADPDATVTVDIIAVLKQGNNWATFWFANETFATDGTGTGTWYVDWCKVRSVPSFDCSSDDVSHMTLYFAQREGGRVPEPGALALIGIGLVGAAALRRRRG